MDIMKKEARKWSYTCNQNSKTKCPQNKWKLVRSKYFRNKNFNFTARTENLLEVKSILDNMGMSFFLTHGTLLGAYRDNEFIKYDDDVDLDIFEEILLKQYDELCENLIKAGFIVRGRNIKYKKKQGEKLNIYRHREKITIAGIYLDPTYEGNKYRLTNVFQFLRKFHEENPDKIMFKKELFNTPGPIEDFLLYRYGKKWNIPFNTKAKSEKDKTNKSDWARGVRRPCR